MPDVSAACVGRTFQDVPGADDAEKAIIPQARGNSTVSPYGVAGTSSMEQAAEAGYFDRLGYTIRPSLTLSELTTPR